MGKRALWEGMPKGPGVYLMRDAKKRLLYIGKAANLRRRVQSYFSRPHEARIAKLVSVIRWIDYQRTETALEALILEAALIKKHQPPYNVREKDDTSFLYVVFTKEKFPRIILARGKEVRKNRGDLFGPFLQGGSVREALRMLRRVFPWSVHSPSELGKFRRPCFEYELGLCPGTCAGLADPGEYAANIHHLKQLFRGERKTIIRELTHAMKMAARGEEFERAAIYRKQLFALRHIQDIALMKDSEFSLPPEPVRALRIEGYDVSNISGASAAGSMVVFRGNRPLKKEYRLFKVHSFDTPNDVGMLREVLTRRFKRTPPAGGWPLPDLILIDGGRGQVNAARAAMRDAGLAIPVVGLAKGPTRKRADAVGEIPRGVTLRTLIRVRDEAHRFARAYHLTLRSRRFVEVRG